MSIKKKSKTMQQLEGIRKKPLSFKDMLVSIRTTDEITQSDLARKVGISRAKLCDIEKGRRIVSLSIAAKLANALGYPVAIFVSKCIEDQLKAEKLKLKVHIEAA